MTVAAAPPALAAQPTRAARHPHAALVLGLLGFLLLGGCTPPPPDGERPGDPAPAHAETPRPVAVRTPEIDYGVTLADARTSRPRARPNVADVLLRRCPCARGERLDCAKAAAR